MDTKDKSIGEEVKSQVLYLLSGQEQGLPGPWLHSALEKTHTETCLQIRCLTPTEMLGTNEVLLLVNNTSHTSVSFSEDTGVVRDNFCPISNSIKLLSITEDNSTSVTKRR